MGELMRQASRLQRKVEKRKEELKEEKVEASAGNDQVKATVNGGGELVSIEIDPKLLEGEDLSMVQDLIVAAANAALKKSEEMVEAEIEKVTGGMKIPGLM
jgi:DNA-binding YbaB/EbfC family protein